ITGPGQLSADGRTLTFPLRPNVTMQTFPVGNAVVIDLKPGATPPAAPVAAPPTPAKAPPQTATTPAKPAAAPATAPAVPAKAPPQDQALALQGALSSTVAVRS